MSCDNCKDLAAQRHELLDRYLDLLLAANERMNLTAITDRDAARVQHVGDSLTLLPHLPAGAIKLVDIGSGGGVPGMVLAIARPEISVTLVESTKKKAAFLRDAASELQLRNIRILDQRAEQVAHGPLRESFDVATARAVATMVWLVEWCLPLLRRGGKMLAMKGPKLRDELPHASRAIRLLGGSEPVVHPVDLEGTDQRVIVEISKIGSSGKDYPRDPTRAKGKPIV